MLRKVHLTRFNSIRTQFLPSQSFGEKEADHRHFYIRQPVSTFQLLWAQDTGSWFGSSLRFRILDGRWCCLEWWNTIVLPALLLTQEIPTPSSVLRQESGARHFRKRSTRVWPPHIHCSMTCNSQIRKQPHCLSTDAWTKNSCIQHGSETLWPWFQTKAMREIALQSQPHEFLVFPIHINVILHCICSLLSVQKHYVLENSINIVIEKYC